MNFARVLRDLWRRRRLVAIVGALAIAAAVMVTYRVGLGKLESRRYHVGVASTRILVDTPSSQVVAVSPKGSDTLGLRANLISSLMVDGVIKGLIAKRAGLPPTALVGIAKNAEDGTAPADPPAGRDVNVLRTSVLQDNDGNQLPIIQIDAQASDAQGAAKLANAAVNGLRDYLETQAAQEQVPDARRLRVHGLGAAQATEATRGPSLVLGVAAAIFVFGLGCATILGIAALVRNLRMPEQPVDVIPLKLVANEVQPEDEIEVVRRDGTANAPAPPSSTSWARWDAGAQSAADARRTK